MMCFRDMTFCSSDCTNEGCLRHFGEADKEAAKRWWGGDDAPVAYCDFSPMCVLYAAPTTPPRSQP